jgi:hypothetical protein
VTYLHTISPGHIRTTLYIGLQSIIKTLLSAGKLLEFLKFFVSEYVQGGSNMTGTNCDLFTHNQSRSYLNHLVF